MLQVLPESRDAIRWRRAVPDSTDASRADRRPADG